MASIRSGIGENMNDRYLFKAKSLDNGEWVTGSLITCEDGTCKIATSLLEGKADEPILVCAYDVDRDTICQCAGLRDKNSKLIWENDIVDFLGHKGTVVFECGSFGIAYKTPIGWNGIEANIKPITGCDNRLYACENDNYISLWEIYWNFNDEDDSVDTVEVIGNIFDNPELLESEE